MAAIQESILIAAPINKVWAKLISVDSWSEWNSFVTSICIHSPNDCLIVGSKQTITITPDKASKPESYTNVVTVFKPDYEFWWKGTILNGVLFETDHWCRVQPVEQPDGRKWTEFTQGEAFSGIMSPLVRWLGKDETLRKGYQRMNMDLKRALEEIDY